MRTASYVWAAVMAICAVAALFVAVWVVITVYEKIAGDSSEWVLESTQEEPTELKVEAEDVYGWVTDENGSRYREDDGTFAMDSWKIWENKLYYLKEDGFMATETISKDGQTFFFSSDGALKDIQADTSYTGLTGDDNTQNLDSLVKGYEFWSYLSSAPGTAGAFKPILYRKTTETNERFLGSENNPEKSTKNSLQIHNGYIYFLPQVPSQVYNGLEENEKMLCNKLFRMRPGENQKELLAENTTGYLVLDDGTVYYASSGEILKAAGGTMYSAGEEQYQVQIRDNACYLLDSTGNPVTGDDNGIQIIGNREYHLNGGKITDVYPAEQKYGNYVFTLEEDSGTAGNMAIYRRENGAQKVKAAQAPRGINSFCIAEDYLYYSAFVDQEADGTRYSEIYRMKPDGTQPEKISSRFQGNIRNLYYYEGKGKIYGEYAPVSWKSCYGQIVTVDFDGTVTLIDDSFSRGNSDMSQNDLLTLVMVNENTITAYMRTCEYRSDGRLWVQLTEKPYQFADTLQSKVAESFLNLPPEERTEGETEESSGTEETEEDESPAGREAAGTQERPGNGRQETTASQERPGNGRQETTAGQERPGSRQETTAGQERPGNGRQETSASQERPENRQETTAGQERPGNGQQGTREDQGGQPSQTAPALPDKPAEPGFAPTAPAQEAPGPGNTGTVPTIEANPESNNPAAPGAPISPGSPEDSVQYIGPGNP